MENLLKVLLFVALFIAMGLSRTYASSIVKIPQRKKDLFAQVANDYKSDYEVDKCYINDEELPIAGIIAGVASSESSYGESKLAKKHNNRGNVKYASQYKLPKQKVKKTVHADGGAYFVYPSVYDGLYDSIHWINTRGKTKCNVTYRTFEIYVKGTKKLSEAEKKAVRSHVDNMVAVARAWRDNQDIYEVNTEETKQLADNMNNPKLKKTVASKEPIKTTGKRCKIIYRAERDGYIQADSFAGRFLGRLRNIKATDKIFFCYDIK